MNEVKRPKKPLFFYYAVTMIILLLFNLFVMPLIAKRQIQEVDYGTFITMAKEMNIGTVEVQDNQILFTDKENTRVYKTGKMNDPELVDRLYAAGAKFGEEIIEETSPLVTILLYWVLPIVIFVALGQFMSRKMMDRMGGGNAMSFNMGNPTPRSTFSPPTASVSPMWRAWTRLRRASRRLWTTSTILRNTR